MTEDANWVLARANCTLDGMFDELTSVMESDIREFNGLSPKRRFERMFDSRLIQDSAFEVYRVSPNPAGELVRMSTSGILVQKSGVWRVHQGYARPWRSSHSHSQME